MLAQSLVHEGLKNVVAGSNPMALSCGIEKATEVIVKELVAAAKDVETKDQIAATATISAADPEVGEKIAEALDKVGQDGVVTVEDNNRFGLDLDFTERCVLTRATSPRTSSPTLTTRPQCSKIRTFC